MAKQNGSSAEQTFVDRFLERRPRLTEREPDWLLATREAGLSRFADLGFPTTRQEEWRNTNIAPIASGVFLPAERRSLSVDELPALARVDLGGPCIVLVDGHYDAALSRLDELETGLHVSSLGSWLAEDAEGFRSWLESRPDGEGALRALNTGFFQDGTRVVVDRGAIIDRPVQLIHVATGTGSDEAHNATHTRVWIHVGPSGSASVVESYVALGPSTYLTNAVTEVELGENAVLHHDRVQAESPAAYHVASVDCRQQASSRYDSRHFSLGGRLVRGDLRGSLLGEGGNCTMDGLYVTRGEQHVDHHTVLDHAVPHCDSRELFKGILLDRSRTVFNGRIIVRQDAQKTDAKQSNPNLLLSDRALAHTRPQLEIYADDVKCTHGATVGQLDRDAIFYCRTRGIPAEAARNLLVGAFAGEILDRVPDERLRGALEQRVGELLSRA
jgi:Fe-S cluster assembly protein SufD